MLRTLRLNVTGPDVETWKQFLRGQNIFFGEVNQIFDQDIFEATKKFQRNYNLTDDGEVGNMTYGRAQLLGFGAVTDDDQSKTSANWPPKPSFSPLGIVDRTRLLGEIQFKPAPTAGNPEGIQITNSWQKDNLTSIEIPQLKKVVGAPGNCKVLWHKKCVGQLVELFNAWEQAGLMPKVLGWAGSWNPRFIRGSRTVLSQHAHATAFDINVPWNMLGTVPALVGKKGSVRELVLLANINGFYWGGHFDRQDGMHFEIAEIK